MNDITTKYYLPQMTIRQLDNGNLQRCKNLGLILDKYPESRAVGSSQEKSSWLKWLQPSTHIDEQLAAQVYRRWQRSTASMGATHFPATLRWRMAIGLGGETVLETDLSLHHLYGIPQIPGSALKGLTRAYVTGEISEHRSPGVEQDNATIKRIFGDQENAGSVIFFDALPIEGRATIELDIMTVHYPDYYGKKEPPTNTQSPNPVSFLTVANTVFMFALAPRRSTSESDGKDVQQTIIWLQEAIDRYGVGGKTSAGYGHFTVPEQARNQSTAAKQAGSDPTPSEAQTQPAEQPYVRPQMPRFNAGGEIQGSVIEASDELRGLVPEAKAFLRYQEFAARQVLIVITADEASTWSKGQTKRCLFEREEERNGCTLLICQPGVSKVNKKKKK